MKTDLGERRMQFKDVLRNLREKAGLTQQKLAEKAGIPLPSLRGHEQGQRSPGWVSVVKLARALSVSTDAFADVDEVRGKQTGRPKKQSARPHRNRKR
jgi:transcriptional regulator with XRE-family HTH domain